MKEKINLGASPKIEPKILRGKDYITAEEKILDVPFFTGIAGSSDDTLDDMDICLEIVETPTTPEEHENID
jgi:hypothetical protein